MEAGSEHWAHGAAGAPPTLPGFTTLITATDSWHLARDLLSKMLCLGLRLELHGITASMSAWRRALGLVRSLPEKKLRPNCAA